MLGKVILYRNWMKEREREKKMSPTSKTIIHVYLFQMG